MMELWLLRMSITYKFLALFSETAALPLWDPAAGLGPQHFSMKTVSTGLRDGKFMLMRSWLCLRKL